MTEIWHLPLEVTEPPELRTQSTSLTPGTFLRPSFKFLFNDELSFAFLSSREKIIVQMHLLIQKFKLWFNKILFCWNATDDSVIGCISKCNDEDDFKIVTI